MDAEGKSEVDSRLQISENKGEKTQKDLILQQWLKHSLRKNKRLKREKKRRKSKAVIKVVGRIDLDKQCGVINSLNNKPCNRLIPTFSISGKNPSYTLKVKIICQITTIMTNKQDDVKEKDVEQNKTSSAPYFA
ncbi:hypothetical protein GLOIN_2v1484974 [Rhizophagus irregularis DAOM 181602=DAOM 197198]|uniref:SCA7 domain-containing protein n=1 Tax=Rhizophagus irregularis (strain DAOM 181602 / DAOM 197198 / MUCL 43194) TaxID=747089 RepID=A0A2P4PCC5_RHIID|nr:hypothetical protein GLOIN_2v1484974 [Rhizophagus irregularis DAOM 181602=DAOM 197198]POG63058.1 hypothetical protein GLOIN_2v1484974 [Rhizophagus irregularis DAOM 181602=DAOM 197198]GBC32130.2 hypothetical protein GLOIN_2v1484974 [Rhizophagus irregularis DAOM 181602=DAOM 197198]|eukprot:XP_025169924.1 hypothetical protein GLOIN_2v1484974 [Rhizophagus irregularis DAOM 181602=DAOM 197198]